MFIELVDSLRCPAPHEPSLLIASAARIVARHILDGELGCPVCYARYAIEDGITWFDRAATPVPPGAMAETADGDAVRLAALLGLTDPGGFAILAGGAAALAEDIRAVAADVHLLLINPPASVEPAPGTTVAMTGLPLPLADDVARGGAVGESATSGMIADVARVVRVGGRVVAPASAAVPPMLSMVAADERHWVARRESVVTGVPLRRA